MNEEQTAPAKVSSKEKGTQEVEFLKRTDLGLNRKFLRGSKAVLPIAQAKSLKKKEFVKFI